MQVGAAAGQPATRVGDKCALDGDHPEQVGGAGALPAPDAGADRRAQTGLSASLTTLGGSLVTSGRMSIRQPVSRAASRAFCPSLPIARDSW